MAWTSILLWAAISTTAQATTAADAIAKLRTEHPELFEAPAIPEWPDGLGLSYDTPLRARCLTLAGIDLGDGTWIPSDLAREVERRLMILDAYQGRSQAVIDAIVPRVIEAVAEQAAVEPDKPSWMRWLRAGLLIVGGVALTALGVVAGWGLHSAVGG